MIYFLNLILEVHLGHQLFYLLSRGLPFLEARRILIRAYLNEILEEIHDEDLIKQFNKAINMWLKQLQFKDAA